MYYISAMNCTLCPRECNVDRQHNRGFCNTNGIVISRVGIHAWEEPCISGKKGSGTIFFAGCNLHCRFCQNYDISVRPHGAAVSVERFADVMLYLQGLGVANINLVTPSHFADKIAEALKLVKSKLTIPIVYNTSSYEKAETLKRLEGLVDVYLPDLKFCSSEVSRSLANADDYFDVATKAIEEMRRQAPRDEFDIDGYMTRGVLIRHLVLPSYVEDSKRILDWIARFDSNARVSLMSQYFAARTDDKFPQLNRKLYRHEYEAVREYFFNVGLTNGYEQDYDSATRDYLPDFDDQAAEELLSRIPHRFTR